MPPKCHKVSPKYHQSIIFIIFCIQKYKSVCRNLRTICR
nr:MAG TPA: hypothetical protein [Bacteriophage sp.]